MSKGIISARQRIVFQLIVEILGNKGDWSFQAAGEKRRKGWFEQRKPVAAAKKRG
jgi:hypothetical protein